MVTMVLVLVVAFLLVGVTSGLDNGLARTPPMGWLSWERFRCVTDCEHFPDTCISEKLYKSQADKLIELGLKDLGYEYINIDDCWLDKERDPLTGKLRADPQRFPSGIKALAKYMHSRGLKLGIYEDFGSETCAKYPGSEFFMELDAKTFAEWEVDMLKFDGCNSDPKDMPIGYPIMQFYLNKTGRPMLYSCEWPLYEWAHGFKSDFSAIHKTCNMWRMYTDVTDAWGSVLSIVDYYGKNDQNFTGYSGPGSWGDPDMLVVGDFGLSYYQQKAQFGMWAMFSAPLFMSVDLRSITHEALALLKNKDVIAINQDPLGAQAIRLYEVPNSISVWLKRLSHGNTALAILNKFNEGTPTSLSVTLNDLGLTNPSGYNVTDVFEGKQMGFYKPKSSFDVVIDPTSILLLKLVPLK